MTVKDGSKNQSGPEENPVPELKILNIRGELYHTRLTKKFERKAKWKKPDKRLLMSYIPGSILKIFVNPGDEVDTGTKLLILEAMKMQNIICSPLKGRVKAVPVKEGDRVRKGVLMVEFE